MKFRASSDPLFMACPAAAHPEPGEIRINPNLGAGIVGTAVHDALAEWLRDQDPETEVSLHNTVIKYNLKPADVRDVQILCALGRIFWLEWGVPPDAVVIPESADDPGYRIETDGHIFTGHTDLLIITGNTLILMDWKTTRIPYKDYSAQLQRYLWALARTHPEIEVFRYVCVFLRDGTIESSPVAGFTREQLEDYHQTFLHVVTKWDGDTYNPGINCTYCPRAVNCPAKQQILTNAIELFGGYDVDDILDRTTDATLVTIYQRMGILAKAMEEAKDAIKLRAMATEHKMLQGEDGLDLVYTNVKRSEFDVAATRDIVVPTVSAEEFDMACKLSKTKLGDAIAKVAPRGKKKELKTRIFEKLREAGAMEEVPQWRPYLKKSIKNIETNDFI